MRSDKAKKFHNGTNSTNLITKFKTAIKITKNNEGESSMDCIRGECEIIVTTV